MHLGFGNHRLPLVLEVHWSVTMFAAGVPMIPRGVRPLTTPWPMWQGRSGDDCEWKPLCSCQLSVKNAGLRDVKGQLPSLAIIHLFPEAIS